MHTSALLFTVLSVLKFSTAVPVTDVNSVDVVPGKLVSVQITGDNFTATVAAPEDPNLVGSTLTEADATLADATLADAALTDEDATLADATRADVTLADADKDLAVADLEAVAPADLTKAQVVASGGNSATAKQVAGSSFSGGLAGLSTLFPFQVGASCEAQVARNILVEVEGDVEDTINNDVNNPAFVAAQIAAITPTLNTLTTLAAAATLADIAALTPALMAALAGVDATLATRLIQDVRTDFRRVGDVEGRFDRCTINALLAQAAAAGSSTSTDSTAAPAAAAAQAPPTVFVVSGSGGSDIQYGVVNPYSEIEVLNFLTGFDGFAKTEQ